MTKLPFLTLGVACMAIVALQAQDPVFSQFHAAPIQTNPAFAGVAFAPRLTANYRNQWPQWPNAYSTYAVAYDQWIEGMNSGVGLRVMADNAGNGLYRTMHTAVTYSYQLQVADRLYFRLGAEAGFLQNRINWNALVFGDQLNPVNGNGNGQNSSETPPDNFTQYDFDAAAGLLVFNSNFHFGLALHHISSPDVGFLNTNSNLYGGVPLRFALHGGLEIPLLTNNNADGEAFLSPNILFVSQGDFAQLNGGVHAGFGRFFAGASYRHTFGNADAAILTGGFRYGILKIGYSYDWTLSALASAGTGGAHEVSFALNLGDSREWKRQRSKPDLNNCFKLFR